MDMFCLGLVVNFLVGLGGLVVLKGSDGVVVEVLVRGVELCVLECIWIVLECLLLLVEKIEFLIFFGVMGGELFECMGFCYCLFGEWQGVVSSVVDIWLVIECLQEVGVVLILFVGGDGIVWDVVGVVCE